MVLIFVCNLKNDKGYKVIKDIYQANMLGSSCKNYKLISSQTHVKYKSCINCENCEVKRWVDL